MVFCIRLLIVLWCSAKTRKINLMVHYVLCLLRSEAEINYPLAKKLLSKKGKNEEERQKKLFLIKGLLSVYRKRGHTN